MVHTKAGFKHASTPRYHAADTDTGPTSSAPAITSKATGVYFSVFDLARPGIKQPTTDFTVASSKISVSKILVMDFQ